MTQLEISKKLPPIAEQIIHEELKRFLFKPKIIRAKASYTWGCRGRYNGYSDSVFVSAMLGPDFETNFREVLRHELYHCQQKHCGRKYSEADAEIVATSKP